MIKIQIQTEEEEVAPKEEDKNVPPFGSVEWIYYLSEFEGSLPTPIDVSITGSLKYLCPELKWYNFDVYPHKIKITNTGYTVLLGAKWRTERPYLEGGPFLDKHVLSQIHFHWGAHMMEGSDHAVDNRRYPGEMQVPSRHPYPNYYEMRRVCPYVHLELENDWSDLYDSFFNIQVTFFKADYMTQEEAFRHHDGVVMVCYMIKYGVNPDERLSWIIEGFPRIQEAQTHTRVGPYPMSRLVPMFYEDYFLYWGSLRTVRDENFVVKWLVPRKSLFASLEQMKQFRKLWDPWDEPNLRNFRPMQERGDRHILFISPHWNQYNSLLPTPRVPEDSISVLSPEYQAHPWMLPTQNAYMLPTEEDKC